MAERRWAPGYKGQTQKGEFTVLRQTDQGYLVEYTSGSWAGRYITMPKETGAPTHEVESLRLSKDQKEELLDVFYDKFPTEFNSLYNYLTRVTGMEPTTASMLNILRDEQLPLFQIALNTFFQKDNGEHL